MEKFDKITQKIFLFNKSFLYIKHSKNFRKKNLKKKEKIYIQRWFVDDIIFLSSSKASNIEFIRLIEVVSKNR